MFFVVKEFRITRKNFEWQKKEQQEKADKEANRQLTEIVKFFARQYVLENIKLVNQYKDDQRRGELPKELPKQQEKYIKTKEEFLKLLKQHYKENTKKDVNKQESLAIDKINEKFFDTFRDINLANDTCQSRSSIVWCMENDTLKHIDDICLRPEVAKHMGIDYKILEKIYNNIYYKDYANQKTN